MNIQYEVASLDDTFNPTGDLVATISDLGSVIDISWQEGSDYITITTDSTVWPTHAVSATTKYCLPQVFLYPLETCSTATTCDECDGVIVHFLCVAGVQWRTSAHESLSVWTALRQGDGYRSLSSVSPLLSLHHSSS